MGERIERFEDLIAWQKARVLTASTYKVTNQGLFVKDYGLTWASWFKQLSLLF